MLRAILFDVDGTLCETEEIHRRAFNEAFHAFGLAWYWSQAEYRRLLDVAGGKERIAHYASTRQAFGSSARLKELTRHLHAFKTAQYGSLLAEGSPRLRPGVERLLREARERKVRLAIATTTSTPNVEALLRSALGEGALGWFDSICAGDSVPKKKPAPDIYLEALSELDLEPEECVAIEDSENGLRSALAAGLPTVVTPSEYTRHHDFDGATLRVDHLGDPGMPCTSLSRRPGFGPVVDVDGLSGLLEGSKSPPPRPVEAAR